MSLNGICDRDKFKTYRFTGYDNVKYFKLYPSERQA